MTLSTTNAKPSRAESIWRGTRHLFVRTAASPVRPVWKHALYVFLWSYGPNMTVATLGAVVAVLMGMDAPDAPRLTWQRTVYAVVFAPIIETIALATVIWVTNVWVHSRGKCALVVALLAGLAHALDSPYRFFGPAWAFFVMAYGYQAWMRISMWRAYAVAIFPHALANSLTFSLLWSIKTHATVG